MLTESTPVRPRAAPGVARALLAASLCALLCGCGTLYVSQAALGQWQVMRERVPIAKLLADPRTTPALRAHLEKVQAARVFASSELALPDNRSYTTYADIGREFVVWNVVATPEFSVTPEHWCFPIAGCVAYRGYFKEARARQFANELAVRGFDVAVDGVPAYSTLGKFADPVLSSMLAYGDDDLAATIFHELAHQLLYVRDDSEFNEAFATTVEDAGLERWLAHLGEAERMRALRAQAQHEQEFVGLLADTRAQLKRLYASGASRADMRVKKAGIFNALAGEIRAREHRDGLTYPLYEEWISQGMNNARLASVATYFDCVPGFRRLLEAAGGDLPRFYDAAREVAKLPRAERHRQLCAGPPAATAGSPKA
jgi:predicted aminopeptidase